MIFFVGGVERLISLREPVRSLVSVVRNTSKLTIEPTKVTLLILPGPELRIAGDPKLTVTLKNE